jgi:hypothetical protein
MVISEKRGIGIDLAVLQLESIFFLLKTVYVRGSTTGDASMWVDLYPYRTISISVFFWLSSTKCEQGALSKTEVT